jgi:hypothetical protein
MSLPAGLRRIGQRNLQRLPFRPKTSLTDQGAGLSQRCAFSAGLHAGIADAPLRQGNKATLPQKGSIRSIGRNMKKRKEKADRRSSSTTEPYRMVHPCHCTICDPSSDLNDRYLQSIRSGIQPRSFLSVGGRQVWPPPVYRMHLAF